MADFDFGLPSAPTYRDRVDLTSSAPVHADDHAHEPLPLARTHAPDLTPHVPIPEPHTPDQLARAAELRAVTRTDPSAHAPAPDPLSGLDDTQRDTRLESEITALQALLLRDAHALPLAVRAEIVAETLDIRRASGLPAGFIARLLLSTLDQPRRDAVQFALARTRTTRERQNATRQDARVQSVAQDARRIFDTVVHPNLSGLQEGGAEPDRELRVLRLLAGHVARGTLNELTRAYAALGRDLRNDALDLTTDLVAKRNVAEMWGLPFEHRLGKLAVIEQIATSYAYANADDLSDAKQDTKKGAASLLGDAGLTLGHTIHGRWGTQFRIFEPTPGSPFVRPILAVRGTEGVKLPWDSPTAPTTREGMLDSYIADFSAAHTGAPQYRQNRELFERNVAPFGRVDVCGHSLGGALCQYFAADHPHLTGEVFTFMSPGIDRAALKELTDWNARQTDPARRVTATHIRTTGDLVPLAGEAFVPGDVYTFERFQRVSGQWDRADGVMGANPHNGRPLRDLLALRDDPPSGPLERAVLKSGSVDAVTAAHPNIITAEVLHSVHTTETDPTMRGERGKQIVIADLAERLLTISRTYAQNLGYQLLLEWTEQQVKKMPPGKYRTSAELRPALAALRKRILTKTELPISPDARDLARQLQIDRSPVVAPLLLRGKCAVPKADREDLAQRVLYLWRSWNPNGTHLIQDKP